VRGQGGGGRDQGERYRPPEERGTHPCVFLVLSHRLKVYLYKGILFLILQRPQLLSSLSNKAKTLQAY